VGTSSFANACKKTRGFAVVIGSHEQINIGSDKKPDLRFVAWARAGEVTLEKGATTVEIGFIRPSGTELGWRAVRWHRSLSEAAEEARKLKRPSLLWVMNGHPCGET